MNDLFASKQHLVIMVNLKLTADGTADHIKPFDDEAADRYRAPALDKGLDILELLSSTDEHLTQAEMAKALRRSPSEIYRMLERLRRRGYVMKTNGDRYELSLKLFALAHQHAPMRRLVSQAMPIMRRFARQSEQSVHLAVYERGRAIVVAQLDAPGYWGMAIRVGAQISLANTGSGHVLLAFQSSQERNYMIAESEAVERDAPPPKNLVSRLAVIRQRGCEILESRQTKGVINLSAPVLAPDGSALAALTCPYIERTDRPEAPDPQATAVLILASARDLSLAAGGASHPPRSRPKPRA